MSAVDDARYEGRILGEQRADRWNEPFRAVHRALLEALGVDRLAPVDARGGVDALALLRDERVRSALREAHAKIIKAGEST